MENLVELKKEELKDVEGGIVFVVFAIIQAEALKGFAKGFYEGIDYMY